MRKKIKFGIISGAGPMAGALLYRRVIKILQESGSWRDADFPEILLLNVPFSEMLHSDLNHNQVRAELLSALKLLSQLVDYIYIACQTLHAFLLQHEFDEYKIVSLLKLTKKMLVNKSDVWVIASRTSRLSRLHPKEFSVQCRYIEQRRSDRAIQNILKGQLSGLEWLEKLGSRHEIVLGCTEFSVATENSKIAFIDPIELAAKDMVHKFIATEIGGN